jgi:hypothetical protein
MKKTALLLALTAMSVQGYSQLINPDFEIVNDLGNAINWKSFTIIAVPIDSSCIGQGMDSLFFTTPEAYSGQRAMEIRTGTYCGTVYAGNVSAAKSDTDTAFYSQSVPFTDRPYAISFYYKLHSVQGDAGQFSLALTSENGPVVADATYTLPAETTTWTKLTVPLHYMETETPALLDLHFSIRNDTMLHYGSRFLIDKITFEAPTSIGELPGDKLEMTCYPVPAKDELNIRFSHQKSKSNASILVTDAMGRTVRYQAATTIRNGIMLVDVKDLSGGLYLVRVSVDGLVAHGKFIKK